MEQVDFAKDLSQAVHAKAEVSGTYFEDAFFDVCTEYLVEAGELDESYRAYFDSNRGTRIDGFGGDPWELDGKLSLVITDPDPVGDRGNLTKTEIGIHTLGCRNQKLVVDIKIRAIDRVCTQFVSGPSSFVALRGQVHPCRRNDVEGLKLETLGTALFRQHISDHDLVLVDLNGIRELPS